MIRFILSILLLPSLSRHCLAFRQATMPPPILTCGTTASAWRPTTTCLHSTNSDENEPDKKSQSSDETSQEQQLPSQQQPRAVRRSLDPLVASLTRMDDETIQAKRTQIPIWGELILDKSLMVFVPVALFAILGLGLSVYVILNSQDAIVDVLMDASSPEYLKGVSAGADIDPNACRGLCSSQQQDLDALQGFMSRFGGAK